MAPLTQWTFEPVCQAPPVVSDSLRPYGLHPASLLCPWGFSRQEHWSGLPCSSPGDLPNPGIEPASVLSPASSAGFFTTSATWEAPVDMSVGKLWETAKHRKAWCAAVHGVTQGQTWLSNWTITINQYTWFFFFFLPNTWKSVVLPGRFTCHKILGKYAKGRWGGNTCLLTRYDKCTNILEPKVKARQ